MTGAGQILAITAAVLALLAVEAVIAARHDVRLRARGGFEAPDDVYALMRIAYPGAFLAMAIEGLLSGPAPPRLLAAGLVVFGAAKALKYWAMAALGERWSFRVIVLPEVPLVTSGPYRWLRHPNYVGVCGELLGAALLLRAPVAGVASLAAFGLLLARRIAVEERELKRGMRNEE